MITVEALQTVQALILRALLRTSRAGTRVEDSVNTVEAVKRGPEDG